MSAGGGHEERALRRLVAADVGEVRSRRCGVGTGRADGTSAPTQEGEGVREVSNWDQHARDQRHLGRVFRSREQQRPAARGLQRHGDGAMGA